METRPDTVRDGRTKTTDETTEKTPQTEEPNHGTLAPFIIRYRFDDATYMHVFLFFSLRLSVLIIVSRIGLISPPPPTAGATNIGRAKTIQMAAHVINP
jgi:hypothetical protein